MTIVDRVQTYVGKKSSELITQLESQGIRVRVASEDGESYMLTCDYNPRRVNLNIEKGIVIAAFEG